MPRYTSMLLIAALLLASQLASASEGLVKKINESYKVKSGQILAISNQFGDVEITHWDKQEVKVEIEVIVDYKNQEKGQEQLDKIQIKIENGDKKLSIKTDIDNKGDASISKNEKMEINYTISMPANMPLELKNKFGDISLDSRTAKTMIELQFGSAKIGKLEHMENDLTFKFSDPVIIDGLGGGELVVKFSKLELGDCGNIDLTSEMSTTNASDMGDSKVKVSHGGFTAATIEKIDLKSSMSTIKIERLEKGGSIDAGYGKLIIEELSKNFEGLEIDSKFGPVEIGIEQGSKLKLDAETSMADLQLPSGYKVVKSSDVGNNKSFQGAIGGDGSSLPVLKVTNSFGSTKIR
ncbi:MAG: hypothetical protein CMP59_03200 [Flavobacteriales bacterium]|nr:hypothetical protein [Flavobacteriales bacterium]